MPSGDAAIEQTATVDRDCERIILRGSDLTFGYGASPLIEHQDVAIPQARLTVILGPNGCGKSTLVKLLAALLPLQQGQIWLGSQSLQQLDSKARARRLALLVQQPELPEHIEVLELVSRGRYPHQRLWRQWSPADEHAVRQAMQATGLTQLARRRVASLSGGQQQRVWLAMVLAQQSDVLLLDEPTSFLDMKAQLGVLDFCRALRAQGRTLVLVLHDINLALRYANHLLLMRGGSLVASGTPQALITSRLIKEVFDLDARIIEDPESGCPMVVPRHRQQSTAAAATNDTLPRWE